MPIVAFLLLAMVLAQRRRPGWAGIVLGIVSAMKFTAWPLAALALFAARDAVGQAGAPVGWRSACWRSPARSLHHSSFSTRTCSS